MTRRAKRVARRTRGRRPSHSKPAPFATSWPHDVTAAARRRPPLLGFVVAVLVAAVTAPRTVDDKGEEFDRVWHKGRWYWKLRGGDWMRPVISGGAGRTLNWKGTTATFATASNWVDQATGLAPASSPDNGDICRWGIGTGATNNACTTTAGDVCGEVFTDDTYTGTVTYPNSTTAFAVGGAALGAYRLGTGMTLTLAGSGARVTFAATSTNGGAGFAVTSNGKTNGNLTFNGVGGLWVLQDAHTLSGNTLTAVRTVNGELRTNGKAVTLTNAGGGVAVNGGTLTTGATTFSLATTGVATFWSYTSGTVSAAASTIRLTATTVSTRTFAGGGQTYGTLTYTVAGSTGQLTVTGSNTFSALNFSDVTNARTLAFTSGTTQTFTSSLGFNVQGTAGKLMSVIAVTAASAFTLSLTGRAECSFVSIKDSTVTQNRAAFAYNATDATGNTRWFFVDASKSDTETGAGSDTASILATLSDSDVGSGADDGSLLVTITGVDAGAGADAGSLAATLAAAETASGADAGSLLASVSDTDSGTTADAGSLLVTLTGTESGAGADDGSVTAVTVSDSDSGVAADAGSLAALITGDESGAVRDDGALVVAVTADEVGSAVDDGSLLAAVADVDSAAGDDEGAVTAVTVSDADVGSGTDDGSITAVTITDNDSGAGVDDNEPPRVTVADADAAVVAEAEAIVAAIASAETGAGVDSGQLVALLVDLEQAVGVDAGSVTAAYRIVAARVAGSAGQLRAGVSAGAARGSVSAGQARGSVGAHTSTTEAGE